MNDDSFNLYHSKAVSAVLFLFADDKEEFAENQYASILGNPICESRPHNE